MFKIQRVRNDKVEEVSVEFSKAKSINVLQINDSGGRKTGRAVGYAILGGLAAMGVILIITLVAIANN